MPAEATSYEYQSEVIRSGDGVGFGRRDVPQSYLESAREQTIFSAQRRGLLGADSNAACLVEQPVFVSHEGDQIHGVKMAVGGGPQRVELQFDLNLFEPFASVVTADLLKSKQLAPDDRVGYRVFARSAAAGQPADDVVSQVWREPLAWADGRLDDWLAAAQAEDPVNSHDYPLFILEGEVLQRVQTLSWKDRQHEAGCWLLGSLFRHDGPEPEIFGVIHTALEAHGLKHDRFGLGLSSETYVQLRAQIQRRRGPLFKEGRTWELEMGFCHSHPFLPSELYGHDACTGCEKLDECDLSSAFLSAADARFHAAIFASAPYAIQMVLGLTPRGQFDLRIYCLDGGRFRRRGFHRVVQPPNGALEHLK